MENQMTMTCTGVSMDAVQKVFAEMENTFDIGTLIIDWTADLGMIPTDFLYEKEVLDQLEIKCASPGQILEIADDAFVSTKSRTPKVVIDGCNLQLANLNFLQEFDQLTMLIIRASNTFTNLPIALAELSYLEIDNCTTFEYNNEIMRPGTSKFVNLTLSNSHLTDEALDQLFTLSFSSSYESLKHFNMSGNELSRAPYVLKYCQRLSTLYLDRNKILDITNDESFSFKVPVSTIRLEFNEISSIESGSFIGTFLFRCQLISIGKC